MKVLVIDDSAEFRRLAARFIAVDWPDARVVEYDPPREGKPGPGFPWHEFDAVLLDYDLGAGDGISWLREWRGLALPPVVFLTARGNEEVAVRALKSGAADYLRKDDLSRRRLNDALREAIAAGSAPGERRGAGEDPGLPVAEVESRSRGPGFDLIQIRGYRILRKLGEGSTASVYLAESAAHGTPVVLKVLDAKLSHQGDYLERFIAEYGAVSKISSPHVVRIHDQGFTSEHAFITMEYLPDGDLKRRIAAGLDAAAALRYFSQIVKALEAIHAAGIVHRDLKPQNILLRADDSLALVDFGIARDTLASSRMTAAGLVLGTPLYMSPEQAQGDAVDARSDLYSAGVILYEMLTGKAPFRAETSNAVIFQHLHAPVPTLPAHLARFDPLVRRLLAKDPAQRAASAREVLLGR